MANIIEKYNQRVEKTESLLCVGLDSDFNRLPARFKALRFPQFEFNKWIVDQTAEFVSCFKPNIAFYEARGGAGLKELKMTTEYLQKNYADIFTICDAKRGDTGNTNKGYAEELFDYFGFDAVTLHPYLGKDALKPFLDRADKGCVILCRTSNAGAGEFQDLLVGGKPLWQAVAEKVRDDWDYNHNCLLVAGATYPEEMRVLRGIMGKTSFLVPGVGAQAGNVKAVVEAGLNDEKCGLIISSSRGIIFSSDPAVAAKFLKEEINRYR